MKNGDLACDTCPNILEFPGPHVIVVQAARAHGWHVFEGPSLTGKSISSFLCEDCVGTARSKLPKAPPKLEDDVALFEVES